VPEFNPYAPPETAETPPLPAGAPDVKLSDGRAIAVYSAMHLEPIHRLGGLQGAVTLARAVTAT
jgi:hypothetical protein